LDSSAAASESEDDASAEVRRSGAGFSVPSNLGGEAERYAVKPSSAEKGALGAFSTVRAGVKACSRRTRSPYRKPHQEPKVSSLWHDRRK